MSKRLADTFTREGIALLLCGLVLIPAIFGWIIIDLTRRQDEIANLAQRDRAVAVSESIKRTLGFLFLNYSVWDEMYERTVLGLDQDWLNKTIGANSGTNSEQNAVLVIDENMKPLIGSWYAEHRIWDPEAVFPGHFSTLFKQALADPAGGPAIGLMSLGDRLVIVAVGRIRGATEHPATHGNVPARYLVFAHIMKESNLRALRASMSWPDMTLSTTPPGDPNFPVRASDGEVVGYVGWKEPHFALEALQARLPALIGGISMTSFASLVLYLRMRRVHCKLRESERKALALADIDPLTGILNRRGMQSKARDMLNQKERIFILLMDFDGFKEVNDRLGHRAGDKILIEMVRRMDRILPDRACLARVGGDEFAVTLPSSQEAAMELGSDLIMAISSPIRIHGQVCSISASVGVAGSEPGMSCEELIRRADLAMYSAKTERAGLTRSYDEALDAKRRFERETADDIQAGLDRGEFRVAYQPIWSAVERKAVGVEALARWTHPTRGEVSPVEFIEVAERSRLILGLGEFILRTACRDLAKAGGALFVSVNLSPVQMLDDLIVETIAAILAETGLPAHRLELEVTEGYLIAQEERAVIVLSRLRALGIRISLDDFGCGYASIGYLRKLPLDKVKIDRSFVMPIETDPKSRGVVAAVVALCRSFDLSITAEGVETEGQAAILREIGCDRLQGYLFGRPTASLPAVDGRAGPVAS